MSLISAIDALLGGELALVGVGVERDLVAHGAAQQFIDRQAEHLAANVPQRDVDGADAFARPRRGCPCR